MIDYILNQILTGVQFVVFIIYYYTKMEQELQQKELSFSFEIRTDNSWYIISRSW